MSRSFFHNQNQAGESYSFTTNKNGTFYWYIDKHDPNQFPVPYGNPPPTPTRNHRFDLGDGSQPVAPLLTNVGTITNANTQSHTYSDGSDKWFTIETDKLDQVRYFYIGFSNVVNNIFTGKTSLDLTPFTKLYSVSFQRNTNITGATFNTNGTQPIYLFYGNQCDLSGTLDLSTLNLSNTSGIYTHSNTNLDEIIFPSTGNLKGNFYCYNCNLSGHYDFSTWTGLGAQFTWNRNGITGFTFPSITGTTGAMPNGIDVSVNDLTGTLDLSPVKECGRVFNTQTNPNLTNIIFPTNTRNCIRFDVYGCDLRHLDISTISGLTTTSTASSAFRVGYNPSLSAVTTTEGLNNLHQTSFSSQFDISNTSLTFFNLSGATFADNTQIFFDLNPLLTELHLPTHPNSYNLNEIGGYDCPLLTDINISAFNVGNQTPTNTQPVIDLHDCTSLSGLTLPSVVKSGQTHFSVHDCNLSGSLDLSNYTGLMKFDVSQNSGLTSLLLPTTISTQTLTDSTLFSNPSQKVFQANQCDLGYVDFKPMSGVTLNGSSTIYLQNNNMTTGEVNHILDDFVTTTWDSVTLDISGTNSAPDSSSGGYDGVAALSTLIGGSRNWVVTTS